MKMIFLIRLILMFGIPSFLFGCSKTDDPGLDDSLAGSISYIYIIEAEGNLNETILKNFQSRESQLIISRESDTEIDFYLTACWSDKIIKITIPKVALSGEPYNVKFDFVSKDGEVTLDKSESIITEISIKGWMKKIYPTTRDPLLPSYNCDLNIDCIVNNQKLHINIKSAKQK